MLQHASNPVDWYPWGEDALTRARRENKPIFLSIGYAACHWCHVMERESFEDARTAAILHEHFISIKVDREQRPDIDSIYMQATTAMIGSGGWPMSVFLTPDLRPFYAGTYFPPEPRYNMPAFKEVLLGLARTWREDPTEIERTASGVVKNLRKSVQPQAGGLPNPGMLDAAEAALLAGYDHEHGGWGGAPKFPQPMAIEFLLRRAADGTSTEPVAIGAALHALRAMARGGMHDVVGGGFSRYSTDDLWRVPHFEKMLYDNAQLALAYLHAGQITGEPFFTRVATETLDFVNRELTHPDGGFYSSLDADSDGVEGSFYVWTKDELRLALEDESLFELFVAAYGVSEQGNWEGKTVLQRALDDASLAALFKIPSELIPDRLAKCHNRLREVRSSRVHPATDDKILAAWNGLALQAFAQAARYLGDVPSRVKYYKVATRNAEFLLAALRPDGHLRRTWREGSAGQEVFLEDYAAIVLGLLDLYAMDFGARWFDAARELMDDMIDRFSDSEGGFFDTACDADPLLIRPKELTDNATPSGNAVACEVLLRLASLTGQAQYRDLAERALSLGLRHAEIYPLAFSRWLNAADLAFSGDHQLALLYPSLEEAAPLLRVVNAAYRPNLVLAGSVHPPDSGGPALLTDRPLVNARATAYVCRSFVCKLPVTSPQDLQTQL